MAKRRLRSIAGKFNFKYLFIEIFLIFIGINLAIWFNNWDAGVQLDKNKNIVVDRVREEILKNVDELTEARETNQRAANAFNEYEKFYIKSSDEVETTSMQMRELQRKYPSYFMIRDSVRVNRTVWTYLGVTHVNLELVELSEIAWRTAQTLDVANEFNYDCLYALESMYNLQSKVMEGFDMVRNSLGDGVDMKKTMRWLGIVSQLESQLEEKYREVLSSLDECH